jgi:Ornithine carbamoyltransferase
MSNRSLISIADLSPEEIVALLDRAEDLKAERSGRADVRLAIDCLLQERALR